ILKASTRRPYRGTLDCRDGYVPADRKTPGVRRSKSGVLPFVATAVESCRLNPTGAWLDGLVQTVGYGLSYVIRYSPRRRDRQRASQHLREMLTNLDPMMTQHRGLPHSQKRGKGLRAIIRRWDAVRALLDQDEDHELKRLIGPSPLRPEEAFRQIRDL